MRSLAVAAGIAAASAAAPTWRELEASNYAYTFAEFQHDFPGAKGTEEGFLASLARVKAQNSKKSTWKAGINKFSGMTPDEFKETVIGRGYSNAGPHMAAARAGAQAPDFSAHVPVSALPQSLDWRQKGVVTKVKDQGGCGGCWSFSAAETLESHIAIRANKLFTFSEQEILACTPNPNQCGGTGGCNGATQELAFGFVMQAGITEESQWPYEMQSGTCNWNGGKAKPVANITGYVFLPQNNYSALMNAVVEMPIAISAAAEPWMDYSEGVFDSNCGSDVDHAIVLVGYGTDNTSNPPKDYWLVRNSWGTGWGEQGYIRIKRFGDGKEPCLTDNTPGDGDGCKGGPSSEQVCGLCGIMSDSSYPTGGYIL